MWADKYEHFFYFLHCLLTNNSIYNNLLKDYCDIIIYLKVLYLNIRVQYYSTYYLFYFMTDKKVQKTNSILLFN